MKLAIRTDFTALPRATSVLGAADAGDAVPFGAAVLAHDERHLRRRVLELRHGEKLMVDLPKPVVLHHGDRLVLEDGRHAEIVAAEEEVYDIRARDAVHLAELAWHIGNRHLAAAIEAGRILILRDHVIRDMLEGLGATVTEIIEPFQPVRGAHADHDHDHHHHHDDDEPDHGYGRAAHRHDEDGDDEPDHGAGRAARGRVAERREEAEHDHGAGRAARRRTAEKPGQAEPDHGAGRVAGKRKSAHEEAEPDHGAGRAARKGASKGNVADIEPDHGAGRKARRKD